MQCIFFLLRNILYVFSIAELSMNLVILCNCLILGLDGLILTVEKLKQQVTDSAQQENKLVLRLSGKEHEVQELMVCFIASICLQWHHFAVLPLLRIVKISYL